MSSADLAKWDRRSMAQGGGQPEAPRPAPAATGKKTKIEAGLRVSGVLLTDGEIDVNGVIDGDVCARRVTLGPGATISGEIVAEHISIAGTARGRITARTARMVAGAQVESDLIYQRLAIEEGANFEGSALRQPDDAAWEKITATFDIPGVELTDDAVEAVKRLRAEFERREG